MVVTPSLELERKELVVVLQEREEMETGLRRQVAELQEMLKEQGSSRQSLVANLEAARQEVEAAMLQRTRLEAEMKEKSALVEEVTKTATVRLEKCKVVELELEESVRAQKELGVKMIRYVRNFCSISFLTIPTICSSIYPPLHLSFPFPADTCRTPTIGNKTPELLF